MNHRLYCTAVFLVLFVGFATAQENANLADKTLRPRIITTTDLGADPDDEQSLVCLLVCANEFDIEGLIVSTGCWKKSQSNTRMLDAIVDAYGKCVDNLSVHAEGFPSAEHLRSISVMVRRVTAWAMSATEKTVQDRT